MLAGLLAVVAGLVVLGLTGKDKPDVVTRTPAPATATAATPTSSGTAPVARPKRKARRVATLKILPTADVEVCLKSRSGTLIDDVVLRKGDVARTFRSTRFTLSLGNTSVRLRVNGKTQGVPPSAEPVGYVITPKGRRPLPASRRPTCAP